MKVIRKSPYTCADFFLVRSCLYQNKLVFGEIKPITSNTKQAKISRNNTFSNCTIVCFADEVNLKYSSLNINIFYNPGSFQLFLNSRYTNCIFQLLVAGFKAG